MSHYHLKSKKNFCTWRQAYYLSHKGEKKEETKKDEQVLSDAAENCLKGVEEVNAKTVFFGSYQLRNGTKGHSSAGSHRTAAFG